ncbi:MAG: hypothetical protein QM781_00600 [Chitinophagaceae bacterium]
MQRIFAIILSLSFLGQSFNQGWYYLGYLVQQKEYVKRCENKARPQLHCNGKCQLMKKILEQEKKEQGQPPELKIAAKADALSSRSFFPSSVTSVKTKRSPLFIQYTIGSPVDRSRSLFHPPNQIA